jgi:S1-C subfamily serine protease
MTRSPFHRRAEVILLALAVIGASLGAALTFWEQRSEAATWQPPEPRGIDPSDVENSEEPWRLQDEENTISVFEFAKKGVVMVSTEQPGIFGGSNNKGNGSGFFIDEQGHLLTNNHVIEGAVSITVHTYSGNSYAAKVVGSDRLTDLAVLKIDAPSDEIWPLTLADYDTVRVGQKAIVLGSPYATGTSLGLDRSPTTTTGIISAKDRSLPIESETKPGVNEYTIENLIQTDAAVNPGNSGGPLLNSSGEVVGVVTAIMDSASGIGFAIPSEVVEQVIPQMMASGEVKRAYMGIQYHALDVWAKSLGDKYSQLGLPVKEGALLVVVESGGPGEKAGLRGGQETVTVDGEQVLVGGDIIVGLEGVPIYGSNLQQEILKYRPGDKVELEILRDGKRLKIELVLGSR